MRVIDRLRKDQLLGVHLALNVFIGAAVLWLLLGLIGDIEPIWAIASMVAASDPHVAIAVATFRARIINALVGCVVGMLLLIVGGPMEWKLPLAMAASVLLSSYVIRIPTMWRQAPITAALVIASGLAQHSGLTGIEAGARRVGEVLLGCVIGLLVTLLMSRIWHVPPVVEAAGAANPPETAPAPAIKA